jgi:hypothetical protein
MRRSARPRGSIDLFELHTPRGTVHTYQQPGRLRSDWRRHAAWLRSHHWTARVVIVTGEITIAYVLFVFGLLVGAGIRG